MPLPLLHGVIPILITPFDATGRIDEESLANLVGFNIAAGVHGGVGERARAGAAIGRVHPGASHGGHTAIVRGADRRITVGDVRGVAAQIERLEAGHITPGVA